MTQVIDANDEIVSIDWNFNIWGRPSRLNEYLRYYEADVGVAKKAAEVLGVKLERAAIITEGGAIDSDGEGTILTTKSALIHERRNPRRTGETEEQQTKRLEIDLRRCTGAQKIIWLPGDESDDDYTRGHIDGIARFVGPGHVLFEVADKFRLTSIETRNRQALEGISDAKGRTIAVTMIESPRRASMAHRGFVRRREFAGLYINFVFVNGGIILPAFGDIERDREARKIFEDLFPDRIIEQVSLDNICEAGGGAHCVTQHIFAPPQVKCRTAVPGHRTKQQFNLQVPEDKLLSYALSYRASDDAPWLAAGKAICIGDRSRDQIKTIVEWKTRGRTTWQLSPNTDSEIEEALTAATVAQSERVAIGALTGLAGVNVPVASAIMAAIYPDRYTVLDFRAFHALGISKNSFSLSDYLDYLECCRQLVKVLEIKPSVDASSLRILDRALWQWSKEITKRK
jgi:agmatine deiminase